MNNDVEVSSGNVYADLGLRDAGEMKIKAALAGQIASVMAKKRITQAQAAIRMNMPQPKVSEMLRGKFRGISQAKMMECLTSLGQDIEIVVKPAKQPEHAEISIAVCT